ncbi:putative B3 domain-containing protein At2g27410 [Ricinus communis]|nr:putative B3 domain-containing protein At2g27410 [Ricinus communis]
MEKEENEKKIKMDRREEELEERRKSAKERIEFLSKKDGSFDRIVEDIKQNPEKGPLEKVIMTQFVNFCHGRKEKKEDDQEEDEGKSKTKRKRSRKRKPNTASLHALAKNFPRDNMIEIKKTKGRCLQMYQEKEAEKSKKGEKGKRINFAKVGLEPPPPMPSDLMEKIKSRGGTDVKLVIMKQLFETDLKTGQDRLSIPEKQVRDPTFLEDHEKKIISDDGRIRVSVIEPCGFDSEMCFRKWPMNTTFIYALTSSWRSVFLREENEELLKKNAVVQLWSFRVNGKLCFALVNVRKGDPDSDSDSDATASGSQKEGGEDDASSSNSTVIDQEEDKSV